MQWVVARIKRHKERWAAQNVLQQGGVPYLPMIPSIMKSGSRILAVARPLFPGYMFIQTSENWKHLLSTFGIIGIVLAGERPATISSQIIDDLKARENETGLVVLPKARFKSGQRVKVTSGAFVNYQGIYEGQSDKVRQQVLLDFLGRKTKVLIADDQLESV